MTAAVALLSSLLVGALTVATPVEAAVTTAVPSRLLDTGNGIARVAGIVGPGDVVLVTVPAYAAGA